MTRSRPPRVLFVCHAASRNGATLLLLHFLQWLRPRVDWHLEVLMDGDGPLVDAFRAVAPTRILRNAGTLVAPLPPSWRASARHQVDSLQIGALYGWRSFDLVYANTSATWRIVANLGRRSRALLWHIHEMEYALRLSLAATGARDQLGSAARTVAVSTCVRDVLIDQYALRADTIDVVPGFVRTTEPTDRATRRARIRRSLGWSEDAFVVGGCGSLGWRKGSDLFVQIASAFARHGDLEQTKFLWIGGEPGRQESLEFDQDVVRLGLQARCARVPSAPDVTDHYCALDAFALTSREDPFPLVVLEAAALGLPVVCFAGSGGAPEFVQRDAGLVSPYLDLDAVVSDLTKLRDDPGLGRRLGGIGRARVEREYGVDLRGRQLLRSMERCMQAKPRPVVQHGASKSPPRTAVPDVEPRALSIAVAVNDRSVLENNLFRSPELGRPHGHQIIVREHYPSASIAYNSALDAAEHDIVVFVHQDVYFPDDWFANLAATVRQLHEDGISWGVLGSFGSSRAKPGGWGQVYTTGMGLHGNRAARPEPVETLDEIVLVLRKSSGLRFDAALPGFHFYGTDICLEAAAKGLRSYAIPGFCVHNTNQLLRLPPEFRRCYRFVKRKWKAHLPIATACTTISRFETELLQRSLGESWARMRGRRRQAARRIDDPRVLLAEAMSGSSR